MANVSHLKQWRTLCIVNNDTGGLPREEGVLTERQYLTSQEWEYVARHLSLHPYPFLIIQEWCAVACNNGLSLANIHFNIQLHMHAVTVLNIIHSLLDFDIYTFMYIETYFIYYLFHSLYLILLFACLFLLDKYIIFNKH